ncbi:MAG: hypothetical protein EOS54_04510 [Mesorhizobium sp.]|nr:hypothetical protein EJ073_04185 [Mesorhizobium sp. M4B.F.Ca.ET.058.02.1.1]RWC57788.1 MAG: hypothetical protein EOS54_04510 [Mesorhizobium sp.]RWD14194.1 MAG: hypothetical protein EOS74_17765 [Mesorhizobium sp.]RWD55883.1 MAG: hypothetical protein EOS75_16490 [Mesorhizobium sp.]TIU72346.1 MAG: hypothetical protein E5W25_00995 [Mesorhizobium sp.]
MDTLSWDKPLRFLISIQVGGARRPDVVAVFGHPDVAGVYWVTIFVAAANVMQNGIKLAGIPVVGLGIAGQEQPHQSKMPLRISHEIALALAIAF